ncbi:MAG: SDR family oxidoreductase [bacterium]|nr:SDR family oxidoreductase [bacterium]
MQEQKEETTTGLEIAVIGLAGRFPGAQNIKEFWHNLKNGIESVTFFSHAELEEAGIPTEYLEDPSYVKAGGLLEGIENFDADFFGYSHREAEIMEPQLRIFHESAWTALEDAGYEPATYSGLIGLFAGTTPNPLWTWRNYKREQSGSTAFESYIFSSNFFTTRIAYKLNLKGPALTVQTACSTSLVAVHAASRALLTGECDMALAGGVTITTLEKKGYFFQEGMISSPDGHCRAFDAKANGTVGGEGIGLAVLKRLTNALEDGDHIYAVIKGSAVNNDGNRKVGYTAPSVEGQAEVIKTALEVAEVTPATVSYIEAHGTGTKLGDPIEIEALKQVYMPHVGKEKMCGIGSVKTNTGHLDAAAGITGFIKTALALKHRLMPPSLNFETTNPRLDLENSPFYINAGLKEWKNENAPLRAGVSSFGIGGTNAHVILEEAPPEATAAESRDWKIIQLSAKTEAALERATGNLVEELEQKPGIDLADVAYTLQVGRQDFKYRKTLVCSGVDEAIRELSDPGSGRVRTSTLTGDRGPIVFMFPGQGAQYVNMGLELYHSESQFREEVDRCFEIVKPLMEQDLKEILYPTDEMSREKGSKQEKQGEGEKKSEEGRTRGEKPEAINRTEITQPLLFIFEYALAKQLMAWGIHPDSMIGHSIGEYTAAHLSGVFSLEDTLKLVVLRGKLMARIPRGAMLSVQHPVEALRPMLNRNISIAALNAPSLCTVSGTDEAIEALEKELQENGLRCTRLHTSHAFHSAMMEPILKEFEEKVKEVTVKAPEIPYISNVTGKWISIEKAASPAYWAQHLRNAVRFDDGLQELAKEGNSIFLEVGPGTVLSTFVRKSLAANPGHITVNLIRHSKETVSDVSTLFNKIGQLWLQGQKINWTEFYKGETRKRLSLPTYSFESISYRSEGEEGTPGTFDLELNKEAPGSDEKKELSRWFYAPAWETSVLSAGPLPPVPPESSWLIFCDENGQGRELEKQLELASAKVITVRQGGAFIEISPREYLVNPREDEDYEALFKHLAQQGNTPHKILHLWGVGETPPAAGRGDTRITGEAPGIEESKAQLEAGYYSLLAIARAIGKEGIKEKIKIAAVTDNMQEVTGEEEISPAKAAVLGAVKTIPQEFGNIDTVSIDIRQQPLESRAAKKQQEQLLAESIMETPDRVIAYRGTRRWARKFKPVPLDKTGETPFRLKEKGVYLITGGTGGIGITIAQYLAEKVKARLVLTARTPFPAREEWEHHLTRQETGDEIKDIIKRVKQMEAAGAGVMVVTADTANHRQMQEVIARVEETWGSINGVVHSAGIADGALIQLRDREASQKVFDAKIDGTLVLESLLKNNEPDFFILCSSVNAILAPPGQVAYNGANAFQDAFAFYNTTRKGVFTASINWDAWQEVGLAVKAVKQFAGIPTHPLQKEEKTAYPLFEKCIIQDTTEIYTGFIRANHWVVNEHRVMGKATLPGTGYLDIAREVFQKHADGGTIEISGLYLLQPLVVEENEAKEIRAVLIKQGERYEFKVAARVTPGEDKWQEHARGKIATLKKETQKRNDLEKIAAGFKTIIEKNEGQEQGEQDGLIRFGPRWMDNIKNHKQGENSGLIQLELPESYKSDLDTYRLHPALMDCALSIQSEKGAHLPFCYRKVRIKSALTRKVFSHTRKVANERTGQNLLEYDVTVMDANGRELVDVEGYTLLSINQIPTEETGGAAVNKTQLPSHLPFSAIVPEYTVQREDPESAIKKEINDYLKLGLTPAEGVEVFKRVLDGTQPQIVISTTDFKKRAAKEKALGAAALKKKPGDSSGNAPGYARPELSTKYVIPGNEIEKKIAGIWQKAVGIEQIGINDNFFELGANSLMLVQVSTDLEKELGKNIPIVSIYSNPTIKMLNDYLKQEDAPDISEEDTQRLKNKSTKGKNKLKERKKRRRALANE